MKHFILHCLLLISISGYSQSNLTITGTTVLPPGNYGVLDVKSNSELIFQDGNYVINNLNTNEKNIKVWIKSTANVEFKSSWNMPGNSWFINENPNTKVNAIEEQNGNNILDLYANLECINFQINDATSILNIRNCTTTFTVTGNMNLNASTANSVVLIGGARIVTKGLNIGGSNIIDGEGFITISNNFNLNHNLTLSNKIKVCYGGHLNNPERLGSATATCTYECPVLPVMLAEFIARKQESSSLLSWTTTSEENSDRFEINRSRNGKEWTSIGQVSSHTESKEIKNYSFVDDTPQPGENLYRLKMIDLDGSFAYSRIISVSFDNIQDMYVYPNPTSDYLHLSENSKSVKIYDSAGNLQTNWSKNGTELDVRGMNVGLYLISVEGLNGIISTSKFLINK